MFARIRGFSITLKRKRLNPQKNASTMFGQKSIWRVAVTITLIAALAVMSVGVVCHSHVDCSPSTCPLCHIVIAPSLVEMPANVMILVGERPELPSTLLVTSCARRQLPARAPPA